MKRVLSVLLTLVLFTGCSKQNGEMDQLLQKRAELQQGNGCSFLANITADYGENIYKFSISCIADKQGKLTFKVEKPETIAGITGVIDASSGKITFDDKVLLFETIADGQITPVAVPWLIVNTLRSGYITAVGKDENHIHATINDTYEEQALELEFWLDEACNPKTCEILWSGTRVLSAEVEDFVIL